MNNALGRHVETAERIAIECFGKYLVGDGVSFELVQMEDGEECLALNLPVSGDQGEIRIRAAYERYTAAWVREAPAGKRHLVSLNYYYADEPVPT